MSAKPSEQEKIAYLEERISYELVMLNYTFMRLLTSSVTTANEQLELNAHLDVGVPNFPFPQDDAIPIQYGAHLSLRALEGGFGAEGSATLPLERGGLAPKADFGFLVAIGPAPLAVKTIAA